MNTQIRRQLAKKILLKKANTQDLYLMVGVEVKDWAPGCIQTGICTDTSMSPISSPLLPFLAKSRWGILDKEFPYWSPFFQYRASRFLYTGEANDSFCSEPYWTSCSTLSIQWIPSAKRQGHLGWGRWIRLGFAFGLVLLLLTLFSLAHLAHMG